MSEREQMIPYLIAYEPARNGGHGYHEVWDIRIDGGWLMYELLPGGNPNAPITTVAIPPTHQYQIAYHRDASHSRVKLYRRA